MPRAATAMTAASAGRARAPRPCAAEPRPGPGGSGGGAFALRGLHAGEHRGGVAVQDLLARCLADLRFRERFPGPVAAELGAVGAADDALGAVEGNRRLDRARTERVAVDIHLRPAEAR